MKKTYLKPAWQVVELKQQGCLLAGSSHGADYKVGGLGEGADKLIACHLSGLHRSDHTCGNSPTELLDG